MSGMICPECEQPLKFGGHPQRGQRLRCNRCHTGLVVTGVKPLELEIAAPAGRAAKTKKEAGYFETTCPQCDHTIKLGRRTRQGETTVCPVCHTQLEVVNTDPMELDIARTKNLKHKRW